MKKVLFLSFLSLAVIATAFRFAPTGEGYHVGDTVKDFKLKNVDGKKHSLADLKNAKGYIVIFTCNHCPYAKAYEDRIIALHNKYAPQGYSVVAINPNDKNKAPDDSFDNMVARSKEKNYPFWYLYDESQEIARTFGATRTPHVYLLDQNKVVRYIGAIDDNAEEAESVKEKYLENAIGALQQGRDVAVSETKAVGCTIKWKKA